MGVIGEYIGRIFIETKNRPLYIIDEKVGDFIIERSSGSFQTTVLPTNLIHETVPGSYTLSDPSVSPGEHYTYHIYLEETLLFSPAKSSD